MSMRSRKDDEGRFVDDTYEWRRLFAELLGMFLLVLAAAGAELVNARFGGHAIGLAARATAPGFMVAAIILFMGSVSGAHVNPVVTLAFAWRGTGRRPRSGAGGCVRRGRPPRH